ARYLDLATEPNTHRETRANIYSGTAYLMQHQRQLTARKPEFLGVIDARLDDTLASAIHLDTGGEPVPVEQLDFIAVAGAHRPDLLPQILPFLTRDDWHSNARMELIRSVGRYDSELLDPESIARVARMLMQQDKLHQVIEGLQLAGESGML